jgi:hypothetical protein
MRAVLKMDMEKKPKEYEREKFRELTQEHIKLKLTEKSLETSIFYFYFSENNDHCYDIWQPGPSSIRLKTMSSSISLVFKRTAQPPNSLTVL